MRASALLLAAISADARILTGTLDGSSLPYLGRFAYGKSGGFATLSITGGAGQAVSGAAYMDTTWCPGATCASTPSATTAPFLPGNAENFDSPAGGAAFATTDRAHIWYFTSPTQGCNANNPNSGAAYTLTLKQLDGGQLSYEELGMPALYGVFWAWTTALVGGAVWAFFFAPKPNGFPAAPPLLIRVAILMFALHTLSNMAHLVEWSVLASSGTPSGWFLAVVGGLLRLGALGCLWVLAGIVATGFGVSTNSVGSLRDPQNWRGAALLGALVLVGLVLSLYYGATGSTAGSAAGSAKAGCSGAQGGSDAGGAVAATTLILLTLGYLAWVVWRWRATVAAEASLAK